MSAFSMENPMVGGFNRERTVLLFRQRSLEVYAAYAAVGGGGFMALWGIWRAFIGREGLNDTTMWLIVFGGFFFQLFCQMSACFLQFH
jgi:hypothetical protein